LKKCPLDSLKNFTQTARLPQTKEGSEGGTPSAVLGVGVYRGGGIETPAPIHLLWLLSLCKESNVKKEKIILFS